MTIIASSFRSLFILSVVLLSACGSGKKVVSVIVEDKSGNTELIYTKVQAPENLVKEIRYYANGDTLSITPMLKGAVHGTVSRYWKGNKLKERITFANGVQSGSFERFDNNGTLVFEGELENGLKTGIWTTWYDDVQMQEQRVYANDVPNGKWTYWYIDGSLKREEVYKDGKLIEEKNYD